MTHFNDQYKDKRWISKSREIIRRDKWHCLVCDNTNVKLEVHHLYYERNLKLWEYENESLVTLCSDCHFKIHNDLKKISGIIAFKLLRCDFDLIMLDKKIIDILNYY